MNNAKTLIIVEGKTDIQFLETFLDAEFVSVNGSAISRETISFIKEASKQRKCIVLTDPDAPGARIRKILNEAVPNLLHAYVPKEKCIAHGKVGIAESDKQSVLEALNHLIPNEVNINVSNISIQDLYELGLLGQDNSSFLRDKVSHFFHLGKTNGKTFLKRCIVLGITKNDLERAVHECR